MSEYPPLSDEEIMSIALDRIHLESGRDLGTVQVTAEFLNPPTGT